ncbi:MAG: nitroreductase family protein [Thermanaerothrix sp.]|nr:nitroreductase family protein [Thermanaerothrix sp.]
MEIYQPHPNLHPLIAQRHSSRLMDSQRPIEPWKIELLLEAARSAPSSNNLQPWRYLIFDERNPEALNKARDCLTPGNQKWANRAPLLILAVAEEIRPDGRPNPKAFHDLGMANENLILQAIALGLNVRPMGGFDAERARNYFNIPSGYTPVVIMAVGYPAENTDGISPDILEKERSPRLRLPLSSIAFLATWNTPYPTSEFTASTHTIPPTSPSN